jgi:hypothetical protein
MRVSAYSLPASNNGNRLILSAIDKIAITETKAMRATNMKLREIVFFRPDRHIQAIDKVGTKKTENKATRETNVGIR